MRISPNSRRLLESLTPCGVGCVVRRGGRDRFRLPPQPLVSALNLHPVADRVAAPVATTSPTPESESCWR
jgi:hypothetical protein